MTCSHYLHHWQQVRALDSGGDDKGHFIVDCFVQVSECGQQLDTAGHAVLQQDNRGDAGVITRAANDPSLFTITEKAPTRAFSWMKAPILVLSHTQL